MGGPDYFLGSVKETIKNGANTLMFYTGAPQNTKRTPIKMCKIDEALKLAEENHLLINKFVCHAPYIINLGNIDEEKFTFSKEVLINELERCEAFHCKYLVLHPGLHVNNGEKAGLKQIVRGLNEVLDLDKTNVIICLETMAGKGPELGINFEQLAYIINNVKNNEKIGVCLDTCHINDAGYNLNNFDKILENFDKTIGINRLKVIHLNDSKNEIGSHKDRHANVGFGTIGFDTLNKIAHNQRLKDIPKILETPRINEFSPYREEIKMLKEGKFNQNLLNDVCNHQE